ncbi:cation:proton antiporter [Jannaschia seohaensis]|uniref:CPA2 family monovalent cation:H+ antiporter-2 n=1 Tax=Jannaschia seohaensis TaxID=475081 RepID=A0A2Y9ATS9_9RHOB|nr:cation:proton antiporter [Jannaschia seohaensis]PWJ18223.1 CPA2 family monovalent cation:H+ antiporter-2 [Jannaschia seohaensis]SSA46748.1 monovalent cation:H+ antiporter-2, CPA2 family [Jannaschia seohaensis]
MDTFLLMAAIYLAAATVCVPLAVRLRLGSVLGYLVAGVLIGPLTGLVGSETADLQHFAEFGVVMMLFIIGLELEPRALWDMRARLLGLGLGQVVLTMAAVTGAAILLGQTWQVGLAIGMILALSSTAIVIQTLQEKGLTSTRGGRSGFSVLLAQDVIVIPMLALMPLLGAGHAIGGGGAHGDGHGGAMGDGESATMVAEFGHWLDGLPGWGVTLLTVGAIVCVILGGIYLTRPVFRYAGQARLREMHTIVSLLFVIGVAVLMMLVGLSPALGTFLAGVVLANSEFRHELEAGVEPFKGLLLGLFFITVGAGIDFGTFLGAPFLVLGLVTGLILLKGLILLALAFVFRIKGRDRLLFTLSLAQAGEFGFVLSSVAVTGGVFGTELSSLILLVIALSMLVTPLLFVAYERLAQRETGEHMEDDAIDEKAEVIIAGVGRFGQVVHRMLQGSGVRTVVLDRDFETIQLLRSFGIKTYMGDPTRPELLEAAGLSSAKVLVVALDDRADAVKLTKIALAANPNIHIVARAYDRVHVYELYRAGARDIVRELFDGSLRAGRYALERLGWSETEAHEAREAFYAHDRQSLRELAALWKPGVSLADNPEYRAKARELNQGLENALLSRFGEDPEAAAAADIGEEAADRGIIRE